ncbi:S8 family peptidase [Enterococcus italicus]
MTKDKQRKIRFEQRDGDNLRTNPAPPGKDPQWVLSGIELNKKANDLYNSLSEVEEVFPRFTDNGIPDVLAVRFISDAKAKSHQKKIINLLNSEKNGKQIALEGDDTLLVEYRTKEDIQLVKRKIRSEIEEYRVSISAIDSFQPYKVELNDLIEQDISYKLDFFEYSSYDDKVRAKNFVERKFIEAGVKFSERLYNKTPYIEIPSESVQDALQMVRNDVIPVKNIEALSQTDLPPFRDVLKDKGDGILLKKYDPTELYPVIGLLDSGVEINEYTKGWVTRGNGSNIPEDELDTSHGTFIAGLLIHGNKINGFTDSSIEGCKIVDVPIVPRKSIGENDLINNIRNAIEKNPQIKIWNLSVSIRKTVKQSKFSSFAVALDEIQDEFNVQICKSIGNDDSYYAGLEPDFMYEGAESIRSITVGSVSRESDAYQICKKGYPSLYSRVGRGPAEIIKPEVVHFGGDVFALNSAPTCVADYEHVSEHSILNGMFEAKAGTSFSTPKVTKTLAEIDMNLGQSDLLLSKTLLIHSASYYNKPDLDNETKIRKLGFGLPQKSIDIMFDEAEYSTTLIMRGTIRKGQIIDIMDFPYPENLVEEGKYKGQIKITLCYKNFLDKEMGSEYSQSNILVRFGTFDKIDEVAPRKNQRVPTNPFKRDGSQNVLLPSRYSINAMKGNNSYATDRKLIEGDFKYHGTKQYAIDLKDTVPSKQTALLENKKWFLYMTPEFRNPVLEEIPADKLLMEYCLIITIEDPEKDINVHDGVIRSLDKNHFNYDALDIRQDIDIDLSL